MNIVTAVRRRLLEDSRIMGQCMVDKNELAQDVAGTGDCRLVVSIHGAWGSSTQTAKFPRIGLVAWADHSRLPDGSVRSPDSFDRALDVLNLCDEILHRSAGGEVTWGGGAGVRVLMSLRETEPSPVDHPQSSVSIMRSTYDLKIG